MGAIVPMRMKLHSTQNAPMKSYSSSEPLARLFEASTRRIDAKNGHKEDTNGLRWKLSTFAYHNPKVMGSNPTYAKVACSCTAKSKTLGELSRGVSESPNTEVSGNKNSQ